MQDERIVARATRREARFRCTGFGSENFDKVDAIKTEDYTQDTTNAKTTTQLKNGKKGNTPFFNFPRKAKVMMKREGSAMQNGSQQKLRR